jgi:glycosyltransferase involved in cell wall biosynthesis
MTSQSAMEPMLSVVIPCFNEAKVLPLLKERLVKSLAALNLQWEVILVDDGSSDATRQQLEAMHSEEPRFKVISFSRNFGHQAAISAGLKFAAGTMMAVMDADLQDPPEILAPALGLLQQGYDVVYAVRRKRKENFLKRAAYLLFYRILSNLADVRIPADAGDFCLMQRPVVDTLKALPERNVFVRGLRAWAGFRQIGLEYERESRAAGNPKYSLRKLFNLAADGIFSFSTAPLQLAIYLGFTTLVLSVCAGFFIFAWRIFGFRFMGHVATELPGWTGVIGAVIVFSGVQLLVLGLIGNYIGRIYTEVKRRPRWVIRDSLGISAATAPSAERLGND